jgi:hypothetical protein
MQVFRFIAAACVVMFVISELPADDQPMPEAACALPEAVYIDPAAFLPESFARVVEEPIEDTPLTEALETLAELTERTSTIDEGLFANSDLDPAMRVTLPAELPLYLALDRMCFEALQPVGRNGRRITWILEGEALHFLPSRVEGSIMQDRTYDVADVLERITADPDDLVTPFKTYTPDERLIDLIQSHSLDAEWLDLDGIGGKAACNGGQLHISQSFATHRQIAKILEAFRSDAGTIYVDRSQQDAEVDDAFERLIPVSIDGLSLGEVLEILAEEADVDIRALPTMTDFEKVELDAVVKCGLVNQDLRTTLAAALESCTEQNLDSFVQYGTIWITTVDNTADIQEVVVYRTDVDDMQGLIDKIQSDTNGYWIDIDGIGGDMDAAPGDYLIVTQTHQVQREIEAIVSQLNTEGE